MNVSGLSRVNGPRGGSGGVTASSSPGSSGGEKLMSKFNVVLSGAKDLLGPVVLSGAKDLLGLLFEKNRSFALLRATSCRIAAAHH